MLHGLWKRWVLLVTAAGYTVFGRCGCCWLHGLWKVGVVGYTVCEEVGVAGYTVCAYLVLPPEPEIEPAICQSLIHCAFFPTDKKKKFGQWLHKLCVLSLYPHPHFFGLKMTFITPMCYA